MVWDRRLGVAPQRGSTIAALTAAAAGYWEDPSPKGTRPNRRSPPRLASVRNRSEFQLPLVSIEPTHHRPYPQISALWKGNHDSAAASE
jgi:hypothetical protein